MAAIGRAVADTLAMPIRTYEGVDVDAWSAECGVREVVEPCAAALLGDPPPWRPAAALTSYWIFSERM
jgi:hypothetical protein